MIKDKKYLGKEVLGFSGDAHNMWLIVYDGKYNYMLFNAGAKSVLRQYKRKRMPSNDSYTGTKEIEYYSSYYNALNNLMRVIVNGNKFRPTFLNDVFE